MRLIRIIVALLLGAILLGSLVANYVLYRQLKDTSRKYQSWSASLDKVEVVRTEGGLLQVSTIHSPEYFMATKPHSLLGYDLGPTTTHIRVPATYHYHIELAREWRVRVRPDRTVIVVAPSIKPTLPVAIDTARLERHAEGRWSMLTGTSELEALQKTITQQLAGKASTASYIKYQRESARSTVSEFVRKWLLTQDRWKDHRSLQVRVFFADEAISELPDLLPNSPNLEP
jgi:hypothetical protein